jgi:hypothetical protein
VNARGRPPIPLQDRVIEFLGRYPNVPISLILPTYVPKEDVREALKELTEKGVVLSEIKDSAYTGRVVRIYRLATPHENVPEAANG